MSKAISKKAIQAPTHLNDPVDYKKAFSRGLRVSPGNRDFIFMSGTASLNNKGETCHKGNFTAQAKRTFENLTALLKSEKADWHDVIHTRCYLKSMKYYKQFNDVRNQFYQDQALDPFPASVCVQAVLCRPELLVEIELIAILKK